MNRKLMYLFTAVIIISISFGRMTVISNASSYADEWLKKKQEQQQKYMEELAKDGNLTDDVVNSITKGKGNAYGKVKNKDKKQTTYTENRGYVYGVDELHITGLPTDERGYTKAGDYGKID